MFTKLVKRFWNDEQGLELSEYAVMAGLIIAVVAVAVASLSNAIAGAFTNLSNVISE